MYDQEGCVDVNNQENNKTASNELVQKLLQTGHSWSDMWMLFGQEKYPYDNNFMAVSNYAIKNGIK